MTSKFARSCALFLFVIHISSYAAQYVHIKEFLAKYLRQITVLELGASNADIALAITRDFDATCVVLSDDAQQGVFSNCAAAQAEKVILLKKRISLAQLARLGECEHFDVVLLLDGFHGFMTHDGLDWRKALTKTTELADHCIMVLRHNSDHKNPAQEVSAFLKGKVTVLADDGQNVLILHSKPKKYIYRTQWAKLKRHYYPAHVVMSTFAKKVLVKKMINSTTPWIRGINLSTFKGLNGSYPTLNDVIKTVLKYEHKLKHNDICLGNMVIQGKEVLPIDFNDPRRWGNFQKAFARLLADLRA